MSCGPQLVDGRVEQRVLGPRRARQRQLDHRNAGGRILDDQRRRDARRQLAHLRLHRGHHLRDGGLDVGGRLEEDLDDRHAGQRLRLDVLDVADRGGQAALGLAGDALAHLLRRQAAVVPDDADHRNVDFRKDVGRHPHQHERRGQHDQHRHHDEGVRARSASGTMDTNCYLLVRAPS